MRELTIITNSNDYFLPFNRIFKTISLVVKFLKLFYKLSVSTNEIVVKILLKGKKSPIQTYKTKMSKI